MRVCNFPNLKAEMARYGITRSDIATAWGVSENTVTAKIKYGAFTLNEACQLRDMMNENLSLDYLYKIGE